MASRFRFAKAMSDPERDSMVAAVLDLIREKNDIDMSEPYPDFQMLRQYWREPPVPSVGTGQSSATGTSGP